MRRFPISSGVVHRVEALASCHSHVCDDVDIQLAGPIREKHLKWRIIDRRAALLEPIVVVSVQEVVLVDVLSDKQEDEPVVDLGVIGMLVIAAATADAGIVVHWIHHQELVRVYPHHVVVDGAAWHGEGVDLADWGYIALSPLAVAVVGRLLNLGLLHHAVQRPAVADVVDLWVVGVHDEEWLVDFGVVLENEFHL